jgi:hypothetical protein
MGAEVRSHFHWEDMENEKASSLDGLLKENKRARRNGRTLPIAFVLMLAIFGLDYVLHPGARRSQQSMEQELKALPLPPDSRDNGFTSGFQPAKGRASRTITAGEHPKEFCGFYRPVMAAAGWQLTQDQCYAGDAGHVLLEFHKVTVTCRIQFLSQDVFGMTKYAIVSTWPQ